jgi:hypothetical protein
MTHTEAVPTRSDGGRRAGATWVAATGAFLLVAAAAVFIAVRWDTLPEAAKLGLVAALTGAFLVGGRAVRRTLPSTGDVLFHLGAFLLPVDVAGLNVRLSLGWRTLLLAEGLLGTAAIGALAAGTGSTVLAWTAASSAVVLALGVAAVTAVPAPLALAAAAVGAAVTGRRRCAIGWAAVAGLAPVLGAGAARVLAAAAGRDLGAGTLAELGLAGTTAARWAALSGLVCAAVLTREAGRAKDLGLAALAGLSLASGAGTAWAAASPSLEAWMLALPSLFVAVEVAAMVAERDPFWHRAGRIGGFVSELLALLALPLALLLVLAAPIVEEGLDVFSDAPAWDPQPAGAVAWTLTATAWFLAAWRRRSPQPTLARAVAAALTDDRTCLFLVASVAAGVVVGTASTIAIAVAFLGLAAGLLAGRRIVAALAAVGLAAWAPVVVAGSHPAAVLPVGLVAAAILVALGGRAWRGVPAVLFTIVGSTVLVGTAASTVDQHGLTAGLLVLVFGGWAAAAAIEGHDEVAGFVARAPMALAALAAFSGTSEEALPVVAAAVFLFVVDSIRTDDPRLGYGAAGLLPLLVLVVTEAAGGAKADAGLAMAVTAAVLTGLAALTPERWRLPVVGAAASTLTAGMVFSLDDPRRFAQVAVLAGGVLIATGVTLRQSLVGHAGGALAVAGIGLHLAVDGVTAIEAYVAPVALQLAVLGWQQRRAAVDGLSSWVAYGPSMGILAVPAVVERLDGGPAWHALVAGGVGVLGVAAGGWKRLAGPLFLGTGLVVGVTFLESLHTLAGVPTWGWLAVGGTTLLATGVLLERTDTSPVDAGRRLVDEVSDRFS